MRRLAAFLRAVNVGGTGKLAMADLRDIAARVGCVDPATHLASGNLMFSTDLPDDEIKARLEEALAAHMDAKLALILRDAEALHILLNALPFEDADGSKVGILFSDTAPGPADIEAARHVTDEVLQVASGHLVIHFPSGMGRSRLRLPVMDSGTMRNRNTVTAIHRKMTA